ncbi:hypothetical protein P4K96_23450 [Bacillus cereus]|nr:hypothetical protein [Bacillus cereus]
MPPIKILPEALYIPLKHPGGLATRINIYTQGYYSILGIMGITTLGIATLKRNGYEGKDFEENNLEEINSEDHDFENYCFIACCYSDNGFKDCRPRD